MTRTRRWVAVVTAAAAVAALAAGNVASSNAAPGRPDLERAQDRLMELEREFQLVVERYNALSERLTRLQVEIGAAQAEVDRLSVRMNDKQEAAVDIAVELYKSGGTASALESVLSAESLAEATSRIEYLGHSRDAQQQIFEALEVDRALLDGKIEELEDAHAEARRAQDEMTGLRQEIEAKVAAQRDEITTLTAAIERAEARRRAREEEARVAARSAAEAQVRLPASGEIPKVAAADPNARRAAEAALSQVGKPYRWGAVGPDSYDCSGLTMWAWAHAGVSLPHNSGMQYDATPRVDRDDWQPGDLLFFGSPIHHVGMYIGDGQMVEAPYTGSQVRVNSAIRSDYVGAGRPGV